VKVLIRETGYAEREVPPGGGWRRRGVQGKRILPESPFSACSRDSMACGGASGAG
jgi:hypothetical protein